MINYPQMNNYYATTISSGYIPTMEDIEAAMQKSEQLVASITMTGHDNKARLIELLFPYVVNAIVSYDDASSDDESENEE